MNGLEISSKLKCYEWSELWQKLRNEDDAIESSVIALLTISLWGDKAAALAQLDNVQNYKEPLTRFARALTLLSTWDQKGFTKVR